MTLDRHAAALGRGQRSDSECPLGRRLRSASWRMAAEERIDSLGGQHTVFADGSGRPPGGWWWWYGIWPLSGHWRLSENDGGQTVVALGGRQRLASQWTATVSADIGRFWQTVVIGLGGRRRLDDTWRVAGWQRSQRTAAVCLSLGGRRTVFDFVKNMSIIKKWGALMSLAIEKSCLKN